ncbi:hypothetical protein RHMOL_Rhmol03G0036800 [Rhododendron molle]|uniref:Uncharacterized protein n=1 Tax=Rhododendron molle TaxID=49168 RepID=A0ACC0PBM9_RHOML|nr:hypothetical protein RHMOL_Rhmol03G0036800 [Rhododendron molle]
MWAIVQKENDILPILRLSYDQMPSYSKPCFQYCSLFEKDEDIYGRKLIYAWIALGYVQCSDPNEELEDIAEGYIVELVRRSILELNYSIFPIPVRRETYKMHDLVHDLAQYVAGNECLTIKGAIPEAILDTIRHVSFGSNTYCTFPRPLMEAKKLRTIFYPVKIGPMFGSSIEPEIASFRCLRVLEGRDFDDSVSLPENIGKLKLLSCYNLTSLGEGIEHLSSLRELAIMRIYKLASLPDGLRHLTSLEVLEIHSCESLNFWDDDDFKGLTSLNTLSLKDLRGLVSLPKGLQDSAAALTHLDILECLNFTSPSESVLPNLLSLQSLTIGECHKVESLPEGMQRLTKLLNLTIYSYNLNTSSYREGGEDWPKIAHIPRIQIVDNNYSEHSSPDTINHCRVFWIPCALVLLLVCLVLVLRFWLSFS